MVVLLILAWWARIPSGEALSHLATAIGFSLLLGVDLFVGRLAKGAFALAARHRLFIIDGDRHHLARAYSLPARPFTYALGMPQDGGESATFEDRLAALLADSATAFTAQESGAW
ncbi:hypothetical protein P3C35_11500 [Mesorhizobium sp. LMG15046]|uniref:hypothetical protein n=1 Tax=Mesorhizobium sp. LMG15046 TaxID=3033798 RepID=UPI0023DF43FD|nr:hypothetical protein [Mesorhizobium sp. LMG15046]MDF3208422.1 hypothetical protein [Mesorhizobium sp. LMG15046]